jgi:hypothetical protein
MGRRSTLAICIWLLVYPRLSFSWGSKVHTDIADAALSVIPSEDAIVERFGLGAYRLREYVLLGDWGDCLIEMQEQWAVEGHEFMSPGEAFYGNDYLIFPAHPRASGHIVPEVEVTYRPFFERALQALRTESPANAARWVGSLLHFVTDTGSPPHAAGLRGDPHTKMENWLDASRIVMASYTPKLLGNSDAAAADAFVRRMSGLIEFSKIRAERLKPIVEANDRASCEPISLESATETAKVAADVIHTLLVRAAETEAGAFIDAEVAAPEFSDAGTMPVKLAFLRTNFSTLSDMVAMRSGL